MGPKITFHCTARYKFGNEIQFMREEKRKKRKIFNDLHFVAELELVRC